MTTMIVETEDFPGMHELEPVRAPSPLWLRPIEWLAGARPICDDTPVDANLGSHQER